MGTDAERRVIEVDDDRSKERKPQDKDREKEPRNRDPYREVDKKDKEKEKERDRKEDKTDRLRPPPPGTSKPATKERTLAKVAVSGLSEDVLTQVAQAKFEAQEDRLRDVARHSVALLRDYKKLSEAQCATKILEIRKSLVKYEMQHVRVWELQEKARRAEIENLAEEIERCRDEAAAEESTIAELSTTLEQERKRRLRYDAYESLATEVNRKKSRSEYQSEIDHVNTDIEKIQGQQVELEEMTEKRNQRAQLLQKVAQELKHDLLQEQQKSQALLLAQGGAKAGKGGPGTATLAPPIPGPVEVIS